MKAMIWMACMMLVGCGAADADFASELCQRPNDAVFKPTVTSLDPGCTDDAQLVTVVSREPRFGDVSVSTTVSADGCSTDSVAGNDSMSIEWSADWSFGFGTATVGACHYSVQLVKQ
jgi:hypothetical protein